MQVDARGGVFQRIFHFETRVAGSASGRGTNRGSYRVMVTPALLVSELKHELHVFDSCGNSVVTCSASLGDTLGTAGNDIGECIRYEV